MIVQKSKTKQIRIRSNKNVAASNYCSEISAINNQNSFVSTHAKYHGWKIFINKFNVFSKQRVIIIKANQFFKLWYFHSRFMSRLRRRFRIRWKCLFKSLCQSKSNVMCHSMSRNHWNTPKRNIFRYPMTKTITAEAIAKTMNNEWKVQTIYRLDIQQINQTKQTRKPNQIYLPINYKK